MTTVINIKNTKKYDVYIGRGSIWGNPFDYRKLGITREECVERYKEYFYKKLENQIFRDKTHKLKNKTLGCFCVPLKCHGQVIADYLNSLQNQNDI